MIGFYERYRRDVRGAAELLLIGTLAMELPRMPGVRYLGFLSEAEKMAALAGARAVVCSSPFESLSIVLLEGFGLGTPGLVNARSAVLADHCRRSNGGLSYSSSEEFAECLDVLVSEPRLRSALAENGRRYVALNYRWDAVLERYRSLVRTVSSGAQR
jgi:glycosyltransferase involved in cell wall biosynthesis